MPFERRPFQHRDVTIEHHELANEARAYLAKAGSLQFLAELWERLRGTPLSFWSAEFTHSMWEPRSRMRWFEERADIRQRATTALTGLPPNTAMRRDPEFQADLIESVIADGDIDASRFESVFDASDLVVYGPAHEFWAQFISRMPWEDDTAAHKKLVAWSMRQLLAERSTLDGMNRKPILTSWDVRSAIDSRIWQSRMPLEIRVAVDDARLKHEKSRPRDPFHARHELSICVPEQIAEHIPLAEIAPVFAAAERAMGIVMQEEEAGTVRSSMTVAKHDGMDGRVEIPRIALARLTGT